MPKSRSEIQKAHRERKKANDANFLLRERQRQAEYRVPAARLTKKNLIKRRSKNKEYCLTYRLKKALQKQNNEQIQNVQECESNQTK